MSSDGPKLVLQGADGEGSEFPLGDRPAVIGRDPSCEIHIENRYISRQHARLDPAADSFTLVGLGGRNPVLVNGAQLEGSRVLADGDTISIADIVLEFRGAATDPLATAVFAAPALDPPSAGIDQALSHLEQRRIRGLLGGRGTLTIMFTDLVNSTARTRGLGDGRAQEYLRVHNALLRREFAEFGGDEVKSQGDGFMVAFTSAVSALQCAIAIQRSVTAYSAEHAELPIEVRIGLNLGEVISEEEDFFGTAVILAARIAAAGGAGDILCSELLRGVATPAGEFSFEPHGSEQLKGFDEEQALYSVVWDRSDAALRP